MRTGHPWIYREALGNRVLREAPGTPVEVLDWDGDPVGRGIVDGDTAISVRMVTRDLRETVDGALMASRVRSALALRRRLCDFERLECMRLCNAESDGIPAVAIDRYADYLVAQFFSPAMLGYRDAIYDALEAELSPAGIYEQRRFRPLAGEAPRGGAELVRGAPAPVELLVRENDLKFWVDVTAPLSTGMFADLREGREAIAAHARDRRVLNLFSYTGAISVYAAAGGAASVTAVDVAAKAHARARKNFAANGLDPEAPEHIVGDAFKVLARMAERKRTFDMVVIDPPAFASGSRGGKPWSAVKDYGELIAAALSVTAPGALLSVASSTHKMSAADLDGAIADGEARAKTHLRIVARRSLPADFPTAPGFPEASYLKFVIAARN